MFKHDTLGPQVRDTNFNWVTLVSPLLSHAVNLPELATLYRKIVSTTKLISVRTFYQKRVVEIEPDQRSIQSITGYRNIGDFFTDFDTYDPNEEIMIIDSPDMSRSFTIAELLEKYQIEYRIIDGIVLDDISASL